MGHIKIIVLCLLLAIIVVIPDVVFELFHGLLELLIESAHILFEIVEVALDKVVEHTFHTDLHDTQIIVFYIIAIFVSFGLWCLWPGAKRFYRYCKDSITNTKTFYKVQAQDYWQSLRGIKKIQFLTIVTTILMGLFFLLLM